MKKLILASLLMAATLVNAAEVTVLEADLPRLRNNNTVVNARFHIDTTTHEGLAKVQVFEELFPHCRWVGCAPYTGPNIPERDYVRIFSETVKIDGLMLMDDKVIYHGEKGDINCGRMGVSRVMKIPTLYLSGNCKLRGKVVRSRQGSKVIVTLKTN